MRANVLVPIACCICSVGGFDSASRLGGRIQEQSAREFNSSGGCLIQVSAGTRASSQSASPNASKVSARTSAFHDIVGSDGALMIALEREPDRAAVAREQLAKVGITASIFPATDATQTSAAVLDKACSRSCGGCGDPVIQSIAHSHLRALEKAVAREEEWTAIFEDDAVPVLPNGIDWDAEFRKAWTRLPAAAKVVRLGWCQPWYTADMTAAPTDTANGSFHWMQFAPKDVGSCTHAYMVHKSIIPSMLAAFPCCCAVDCCYGAGVFAKQNPAVLANLIAVGGDQYISDRGGNGIPVGPHMVWRGVMMQEMLGSSTNNRAGGMKRAVQALVQFARSTYNNLRSESPIGDM